jgi:hypothetical protein
VIVAAKHAGKTQAECPSFASTRSLYNGIMPFVYYANCPAQFCPGIVIPAREMNARQIFDKPSGIWNLQCSICLHKFSIAEIHLKSDEFSLAKLRQLYPEAARS